MKSKRRKLTYPPKAKLLFALLWSDEAVLSEVEEKIQKSYGKIQSELNAFLFDSTNYYEMEMGGNLKKKFIFVGNKVDRTELVKIKNRCVELEDLFLNSNGDRKINIDPMIMTEENLVVATGKLFPHRPYLGEGVFAQVELVRKKGHFEGLPWTYPDYLENVKFFEKIYDIS